MKTKQLLIPVILIFFSFLANSQNIWEAEAENANVFQGSYPIDSKYCSGGKFAGAPDRGGYFRFTGVNITEAGIYKLMLHYITMQQRRFYAKINDQQAQTIRVWDTTGGWDGSGSPGTCEKSIHIYLEKGVNTIEIGGLVDEYAPSFDKLSISQLNDVSFTSWEAEDFDDYADGVGFVTAKGECSGRLVGNINNSRYITFCSVLSNESKTYNLEMLYTNMDANRAVTFKINNETTINTPCNLLSATWDGSGVPSYQVAVTPIVLNKGMNKIEVYGNINSGGDGWAPNLDKFQLSDYALQSENGNIKVDAIRVKNPNISLLIGDNADINIEIIPVEATGYNLKYELESESAPGVIKVENNEITAQKTGTATIKISLTGNPSIYTIANIAVKRDSNPIKSLAADPLNLIKGQVKKVELKYNPANTKETKVYWEITEQSDDNIASIDQTGNISALKTGTAKIKATSIYDSSVSVTIPVEIIDYPYKDLLTINGDDVYMTFGTNPWDVNGIRIGLPSGIENEDSGNQLYDIWNGNYVVFKDVDFGEKTHSIDVRCNIPVEYKINYYIDRTIARDCSVSGGTYLGSQIVKKDANDTELWHTLNAGIIPTSGKHDLYLEFSTSGSTQNNQQFGSIRKLVINRNFTVAPESVSITNPELHIVQGTTIDLELTASPENAYANNLEWTLISGSPGIVEAGHNQISGLEPGTVSIKGTSPFNPDASVMLNITVDKPSIKKVPVTNILTTLGTEIELPSYVYAIYDNGTYNMVPVVWNPLDKNIFNTFSIYTINGTVEGYGQTVYAKINVVRPERKAKILCAGNSITEGVGTTNSSKDSYPAQLQTRTGTKYNVGNYGVSGTTLLKEGGFPYWITDQYKNRSSFNPDVVVIELGTNDSRTGNWFIKDNFTKDYKELINSYKSGSSKPMVCICIPPDVPGKGKWHISDRMMVRNVMPEIIKVIEENDVALIDNYTITKGLSNFFTDEGVHPNDMGATRIADNVFRSLTGNDITNRNGKIRAINYTEQFGNVLQTATTGNETDCIRIMDNNNWVSYANISFDNISNFDFTYSSNSTGCSVEFHLDAPNGELAASSQLETTGSWQTYVTKNIPLISSITGTHTLYMVFKSEKSDPVANIAWLKFGEKNTGLKHIKSDPISMNNPIDDKLLITSKEETIENIKIFDLTGHVVYQDLSINKRQFSVPCSNWNKGFYFIQLIAANKLYTKKILKK